MKFASVYIPRATLAVFLFDFVVLLFVSGFLISVLNLLPASKLLNLTALQHLLSTHMPHMADKVGVALLYMVIILSLNISMGLYQRRYMHGRAMMQSFAVSTLLALVILLVMDNIFLEKEAGLVSVVSLHLALFAILAAFRPAVIHYYSTIASKRRFALIGSKKMADMVRTAMRSVAPCDFVVVEHRPIDCVSQREALPMVLENLNANADFDSVYVEMNSVELDRLFPGKNNIAGHRGPRTFSVTSLFERYSCLMDVELEDADQLAAKTKEGHRFFWLKRLVETTITLMGMVVVLPVMLIAAIAIKLDDGGSLFYRQQRVGKNGRLFHVYKFRSMIENAEQSGQAQWAKVGDPRITRVGDFLRKSRIDELPQLLNIIKGDMALVGPRPERPEFVAELSDKIPGYDNRHVIRPGLTGWAQVNYPYGASLEDSLWKTKYDLFYLKNWTIWFDLAIIAQTVHVVLFAEGSR